ncbi:MAG: hypothetical protein QOF83_4297 [Solirubrobacteraceae bacterium]|jgi:hypothetical protein|nr:hypothetical protein [Solirubrobacteraceae bacterium]
MRGKRERRKLAACFTRMLFMTNTGVLSTERLAAAVMMLSVAVGVIATAIIGDLTGYGWLYLVRDMGWFSVGPRIGDSLPLLQLASADGQPLLAVVVAWLLAGGVAGLVTVRLAPHRRAVVLGLTALVALLIASQASYAVARNLRFRDVLLTRGPGLGPWVEALIFTLGCALPRGSVLRRLGRRRNRQLGLGGGPLGHLGLSPGERGHAAQHHGDRDQVNGDRRGIRAE